MRLLDTNIVSIFFKKDHPLVAAYAKHVLGYKSCLSFMTVAELYRWPIQRNWGQARIDAFALVLKNYTILPYDDELARTWAVLTGKTCAATPLPHNDSWIAATALRHDLLLVTHNPKDFRRIPGLRIITECTT